MAHQQPLYSPEETARRGDELYETLIRPKIAPQLQGQVVAIDIETGDFAIAPDAVEATNLLTSRREVTDIWFVRIGHQMFHRIAHIHSSPELFVSICHHHALSF